MIITSFQKSLENYDPMEIKAYDKYKKIFKSTASSGIKGNIFITAKNMRGAENLFILTRILMEKSA